MMLRFYSDDGSVYDPRLANLLEKYGFSGIFYIAPYYSKYQQMTVKEIEDISKKHEIGGHTLTHQVLTRLSKKDRIREVLEGKHELEDIIKKPITKFAFPKGWYNEEVIDSVKKCGFKEARTMKQGVTDIRGYGKFEIPVSVHFYPGRCEEWKEFFIKAKKEDGYFGVVCHAHELQKFDLWDKYEKMLGYIKNENLHS